MATILQDTPTLQLIAYSSLTLASVIVSATSLFIGFRQNFGWKPVILLTQLHEEPFEAGILLLKANFEIWNRQKYPINVRKATLAFADSALKYDSKSFVYEGQWVVQRESHTTSWTKQQRLEPGSHLALEGYGPIDASRHPKNIDLLHIEMEYFDPIKNKNIAIRIPGHYKI